MKHLDSEMLMDSPVIAAIKDEAGMRECLTTDCKVIFVLYGNICNIGDIVHRLKEAGKIPIVHMDLITGLSSKEVSVDYIKDTTRADGIITTKPLLVKRAKELNMSREELKEAATSSAVFSIIPSLPIIISYLILVPSLGRYFPWLRLSVVGSASYETMAANMAAEAFGLESISVPDIPVDVFVCIVFVVTVGILGGNIFNVFFLKTYDKKVESLKTKNAKLVPVITTAMFLGLYGTMSAPHITNFTNIPAVTAIAGAGIAALIFDRLARKVKRLKEFAFPLSMIVGMLASCVVNAMIV